MSSKSKDNKIRSAYAHGYSRRQIAEIFNVSERKVITVTRNGDKEAHKHANKEANKRLNDAVKGWKKTIEAKTGKKPSAKEIREQRKIFVRQRIYSAMARWGEKEEYIENDEDETLRTYIEVTND